tara:strand:+ start:1301 stop:2086 length:786 start_codon:yes stop_codon:yes gene_type:complete
MEDKQVSFAILRTATGELHIPVSDVMVNAIAGKDINVSYGLNSLLKARLPVKKSKTTLTIMDTALEVELDDEVLNRLNELNDEITSNPGSIASDFYDLLRAALPYEERPCSSKQFEYAQVIAMTLGISLPKDLMSSSEVCSEFIEKYQEEFKSQQAQKNAILNHARKLAKQGYADFLYRNDHVLIEICSALDVAREATVIKYIKEYREWFEEFKVYKKEYQSIYIEFISDVIREVYPGFTDFVETIELETNPETFPFHSNQ